MVNIYIVYKMKFGLFNVGKNFALAYSLFWSFKFTKNADLDKYKYFGYGIGFDAHKSF